ncbi:CDGSH iron-sulfur domain-containing protein [Schleiferia thermophila]|jgi:CDGSH-type Zn-finger protein|nr:glutamate synthase [Fischerella thermalis CCMEE 5319]
MNTPEIAQKSPYILELQPGKYWWCACGKSSKQPFCDGSHKGSAFRPVVLEIEEPAKVALCGCKHSAHAPKCDGTHRNLKVVHDGN